MAHGPRNRNWGSGRPPKAVPAIASEFEVQARQLGLTPQTYAASYLLRKWCKHNRNRCYIPEWLLDIWGISIES